MRISVLRAATVAASTALVLTAAPAYAAAHGHHANHQAKHGQQALAPRTHFRMLPDGSSGLRVGGEGIPNIDSVKSTIYSYYGDPGTGIANKRRSPYISQMKRIEQRSMRWLREHRRSTKQGRPKAIVLDADDTTLSTYDMEVAGMHFNFDPALQDVYVQDERFPATPGMVRFVNKAEEMGYKIFGLTGRNDDQLAATVKNLAKVGYRPFNTGNFYTKWTGKGDSQKPSYITCVNDASCTTVEYKAGTRKHIEKLGYRIVLNVGDQWSDLQGGHADHTLKLPNPTYYLPSPNLPGKSQPRLAPRTHFTMKPDGSSGLRGDGEGIPNIDSDKATIRAYYGDTGDGTANKTTSPYIRQMARITARQSRTLNQACRAGARRGQRPAVVLDADDTTLWTYDLEAGIMKFNFDPAVQDGYVQAQKFPATPGMVRLVNKAHAAGCTLVGLTGRNDDQKAATIGNLAKVGYKGFTAKNYYTKWTGKGSSQQPGYIHCKKAACTTTEYKSQTRKHVQRQGYSIVANFGDQFSDLKGGHAKRTVKLPNPTYYLP